MLILAAGMAFLLSKSSNASAPSVEIHVQHHAAGVDRRTGHDHRNGRSRSRNGRSRSTGITGHVAPEYPKISLTTAGEYMLVYARKILATVKDAEDAAARLQRAETGLLTIGFVSTAKYFMMILLVSVFRFLLILVPSGLLTGSLFVIRGRIIRL